MILGSSSPRRQLFLEEMNIPFTKIVKEVDELFPPDLKHSEITDYLVKLKAEPFLQELKANDLLLTCDTIVWHQNKMLGKPKEQNQAIEMLTSLSGKTHEVISSICFTNPKFQVIKNSVTKVYFEVLTNYEIEYYVDQFKPFDKAGAYGIQEWIGMIGISKIEGSYENVVGLPTELFYSTLQEILEQD
ncbi:septum formation protein [Flavobacteriaceae bacterium MAR_2010_188]|nr:septum formation protein [Flavobacteriaceae bacterium MAR_2010_188]